MESTNLDDSEWSLLCIPPVLKKIGFQKGHLEQIKNKFKISAGKLARSLEAYAHDLANGRLEEFEKRGTNPISLFFGAVKNGEYVPIKSGFKTGEEQGKAEMIARLEQIKRKRAETKERLEELLFEEWLATKSKDEILAIARPSPSFDYLDLVHKSGLRKHFIKYEIEKFQDKTAKKLGINLAQSAQSNEPQISADPNQASTPTNGRSTIKELPKLQPIRGTNLKPLSATLPDFN